MVKPAEPEQGNMEGIREVYDDGLYDGGKMEAIKARYRNFRLKEIKLISWEGDEKYLNFLFLFLKQKGRDVSLFNGEALEAYKYWLLEQKEGRGLGYSSLWLGKNLNQVRMFLEWGVSEGLMPDNPLALGKISENISELKESIRSGKQKKYLGKVSDPEILLMYQEHSVKFYTSRNLYRIRKVLKILLDYAGERNKSFTALSLEELNSLRQRLSSLEIWNSIKVSATGFAMYCTMLKTFYLWLYEEGFSKAYPLKAWSMVSIEKAFVKPLEAPPLKQRYYTLKEILRAYKRYLISRFKSLNALKDCYGYFLFFIRFLKKSSKTLYTADEKDADSFKEYLLNYEYLPGRYYSPNVQASIAGYIKRFYDWFTFNGYSGRHPFKEYKPVQYRRWVKANTPLRKETPCPETVPMEFRELNQQVYEYEKRIGLSRMTIQSHQKGCAFFFSYLVETGIYALRDVSRSVIHDYLVYLTKYRNRKEKTLSVNVRIRLIAGLRGLYRYLEKFSLIEGSLSNAIEYPKAGRGLPTPGMNDREVKTLLQMPDGSDGRSIRDRAVMELLYSSGMRSNEIRTLKIQYIDLNAGMVRIDEPKGGKGFERVIPIGKTACFWTRRYIHEVRQKDARPDSLHLFINKKGDVYTGSTIKNILRKYHLKSGLRKKRIVTHSFRVSCATEMLKRGADIKIVQEQLGHRSIQSTEKYLRLVPTDLKKAHLKYHPRDHKEPEIFSS